jgi:hypothetical protein
VGNNDGTAAIWCIDGSRQFHRGNFTDVEEEEEE